MSKTKTIRENVKPERSYHYWFNYLRCENAIDNNLIHYKSTIVLTLSTPSHCPTYGYFIKFYTILEVVRGRGVRGRGVFSRGRQQRLLLSFRRTRTIAVSWKTPPALPSKKNVLLALTLLPATSLFLCRGTCFLGARVLGL